MEVPVLIASIIYRYFPEDPNGFDTLYWTDIRDDFQDMMNQRPKIRRGWITCTSPEWYTRPTMISRGHSKFGWFAGPIFGLGVLSESGLKVYQAPLFRDHSAKNGRSGRLETTPERESCFPNTQKRRVEPCVHQQHGLQGVYAKH